MSKDVTFFFPTRNRPELLDKTLMAIESYSPDSIVFVGNCSSKGSMADVSDVISSYSCAKEFQYSIDPGMGVVFTELFDMVETKYAVTYADDVFLMRDTQSLVNCFNDEKIMVVSMPMIDDINNAPSITVTWPKDEFGCVIWQTPTGRFANHAMVRTSFFKNHGEMFTDSHNIDGYFHLQVSERQRVYPADGAYLYHVRYDDDTRKNCVVREDKFRYPVGHPLRAGSRIMKAMDRE